MRKSPVTGGTQPPDFLAKSSLVTQLKPPAHGRPTFVPTSLPQVSLVRSGSFCGWAPSFRPQRLPTIGSLVPRPRGRRKTIDNGRVYYLWKNGLISTVCACAIIPILPWDFAIICSLRNTCLRCHLPCKESWMVVQSRGVTNGLS